MGACVCVRSGALQRAPVGKERGEGAVGRGRGEDLVSMAFSAVARVGGAGPRCWERHPGTCRPMGRFLSEPPEPYRAACRRTPSCGGVCCLGGYSACAARCSMADECAKWCEQLEASPPRLRTVRGV